MASNIINHPKLIYKPSTIYIRSHNANHKCNAKQNHLGYKKGEANQKQQLSDCRCIRT